MELSSLILFFFLLSLIPDIAALSKSPTAFVFPVRKHASTLQYTTTIYQRTPLVPIDVAVDLGGAFLWVSCGSTSYASSTFNSPHCPSPQCSIAHSHNSRPQCSNNSTCIVYSKNVFTSEVTPMKLCEDVLKLQTTNGLNPTSVISVPQFLFLCAPYFHSKGLPIGTKGVAGLGHGRLGLPSQLETKFNVTRKFSICFSPSPNALGVLFFGEGPYVLSPGIDVSKLLIFTPLIRMPAHKPSNSYDYYIKVGSIRINGKTLPLNSSLPTKIGTISPYTILETSIYTTLTRAFIEEAMLTNISRVEPIAPLDICFSTKNNNGDLNRPGMPVIDLVLQDENVFWRVFEFNSMVQMGNDSICLGFLDGGLSPRASIAIGSYLLEDNLLQFDVVSSRLGFTNSLLVRETNCASFNFTPAPV